MNQPLIDLLGRIYKIKNITAVAIYCGVLLHAGVASSKAVRDFVRIYPSNNQENIPVDTLITFQLNDYSKRMIENHWPVLMAKDGTQLKLIMIKKQQKSFSRGVWLYYLFQFKPERTLQSSMQYCIKWPILSKAPSALAVYCFTTDSAQAKDWIEETSFAPPFFELNKPGCGAMRRFVIPLIKAGPFALSHIQLAQEPSAFDKIGEKMQSLLADFIEVATPGQVIVGQSLCGLSNFRIIFGEKLWLRIRFIGPTGKASPWSLPMELLSNPKDPRTRWVCPPQC